MAGETISNTDALKKLIFSNAAKWLGAILLAVISGTGGTYYGKTNAQPEPTQLELTMPEGVTNAEFHKIDENTYVVVPIEHYWVGNVVDGKLEFRENK